MSDNLSTALLYMNYMSKFDLESAFTLVDDNASFQSSDGTIRNKDEMRQMFKGIGGLLINPLEEEIVGTTCEGDRVAVESKGSMLLANGNTYKNIYHFLFEFKDGRIVTAKEYCNSRATDAFR